MRTSDYKYKLGGVRGSRADSFVVNSRLSSLPPSPLPLFHFPIFPSFSLPFRGVLFVAILLAILVGQVAAHPLGNFTINHFARVEAGAERVRVRYVVDMAEIPTFQQSQAIDTDADGKLSKEELDAYLVRVVPHYAEGLVVTVDGARVAMKPTAQNISMPKGNGGLPTLRVEAKLEGELPPGATGDIRQVRFENNNHRERAGWYEIVVAPAPGASVFDSTAYGSPATDELKAYPQDMLAAPLDERAAEFSFARGVAPAGATALRTRDGRPIAEGSRDRFAELINVPELTPMVALVGLLFAAGFGALHAFSPGHGKTVVGAYLVGSRGTARHAAFLGLTVTITHTAGVFALGLVTLFASQYVMPERLYPILSFVSGAIVLSVGLSLFVRRLRATIGGASLAHDHAHHDHNHQGHTLHHGHDHDDEHAHVQAHALEHSHSQDHAHAHPHAYEHHVHSHHDQHEHSHQSHAPHHSHEGDPFVHSHDGHTHSHLPPGADGGQVTWRNLLALGISGGLLPCPSALVVLLSAITLGRVSYGLALVVAFSVGLAATLTAIGLLFVYAKQFIGRPMRESRLVRMVPVASALVIACLGAALCYEALAQSGVQFAALAADAAAPGAHETAVEGEPSLASLGALAVLGLGLVFGLKHATEADHVVAVSTIVSEQRNLWRAALVGVLWGAGHTASLVVVGVIVLALRIAIPEYVGAWLEFGVALMIIGLGVAALARALRKREDVHLHQHTHDGVPHAHIHFHEEGTEHAEPTAAHSHAVTRIGVKPVIVGAVHGLAGSAALTLLVLTQIQSMVVGLLYLIVFGVGSVAGMLIMSSLVGLPFALGARRFSGLSNGLQTVAGALSVAFGIWYAYGTGVASDLLAKVL
ncbi:MAG: sulfite exporter TauE/SafE family protein [Acidobacteriota bacterium]|nr:sulfite exporter TauE/SafE family protein [Acidobacteriota bacterium]